MGKKTEKKINSDRINILRKQYDAFLEEDKKRKDRNEYILGKLDTMRSSTALQLRQSPSQYGGFYTPSYSRHAHRLPDSVERCDVRLIGVNQQVSRPTYKNIQLDVPNVIQETMLLNEISKKYILIPKLSATYPNDYPANIIGLPVSEPVPTEKSDNIDNNDWKSKYDILEQLKTNEKPDESRKYAHNDEILNNKEPIRKGALDSANNNENIMQSYKTEGLATSFEDEIPVKDISDEVDVESQLQRLQKCTINENNSSQIVSANNALVNKMNYDSTQNKVYDQIAPEVDSNVDNILSSEKYEIPESQIVETDYGISNTFENNGDEQEFQSQQDYPLEYEHEVPMAETDVDHANVEKVVFGEPQQDQYSPTKVENPTQIEINQENIVEAANANIQYPVDTVYAQDYAPDDTVVMQDTHNIDPQNYVAEDGTVMEGNPVPQMSENTMDNSGIEDFDAEQRDMFYSEETDPNVYDQQVVGDAYNQEYNNETYPPQDYVYYEEGEHGQHTIPVEVNEHEETQQLYDQQYEQQYSPSYEQQPVYMEQDPNQQQYEQPALYDEQALYDQQQAETLEQVEQVLDREDGYVIKQEEEKPINFLQQQQEEQNTL